MPFFSYNTGIPAANNNPSVDQPNMQTNTNSINSILNVDHYNFNDNEGGHHRQTTFVDQTIPTTAVGQSALYSKTSGQSQVYATGNNGGKEYQLTRMIDASFASFGTAVPLVATGTASGTGMWSFLPGGLLIQTGDCTNDSTAGGPVFTFPVAFTSVPISIVVTADNSDTNRYSCNVVALSSTQFRVDIHKNESNSSFASNFTWIAIGK